MLWDSTHNNRLYWLLLCYYYHHTVPHWESTGSPWMYCCRSVFSAELMRRGKDTTTDWRGLSLQLWHLIRCMVGKHPSRRWGRPGQVTSSFQGSQIEINTHNQQFSCMCCIVGGNWRHWEKMQKPWPGRKLQLRSAASTTMKTVWRRNQEPKEQTVTNCCQWVSIMSQAQMLTDED